MTDYDGLVPSAWLAGCVEAHRLLGSVLAGAVTDDVAREPCALPGWSVGHLLTHLARNADAHTWVVESAGRGQTVPMYPGGPDGRAADIEAGAGRPAHELLADVAGSTARLEAAWAAASHEVWAAGLGVRAAGPATVSDFVFLRWREVEIHGRDLGPGAGDGTALAGAGDPWASLPAAYLDREWVELTTGLSARLPEGVTAVLVPGDRPSRAFGQGPDVVAVHGTAGRLVAWMADRWGDLAWPVLRPWSY